MITNGKKLDFETHGLAEAIILDIKYDMDNSDIDLDDLIDLIVLVQALLNNDEAMLFRHEFEAYMSDLFELIKHIMIVCKENEIDKISIIIEDGYVDKYYRDSYYLALSSKHFDTKRNCVRLFLFLGDINDTHYIENYSSSNNNNLIKRCIGYISLSPFRGCNISRALLSPEFLISKAKFNKATIRIGEYKYTMYGKRLLVKAFPYMKQDAETISCAEVTALLITDYYSLMYQEFHLALPSEIIGLSGTYISQRVTPSNGMKYDQLSHVLKDLRFSPYLFEYNKDAMNDYHFIMHSYLDSSIPVAIHLSGIDGYRNSDHSILCIGFTNDDISIDECKVIQYINNNSSYDSLYIIETSEMHSEYIVMDDNDIPYKILKFKMEEPTYDLNELSASKFSRNLIPVVEWENSGKRAVICDLMTPLNRRMNMLAPDAKDIFMNILTGSLGIISCLASDSRKEILSRNFDNTIPGVDADDPIIARIFMATSNTFKRRRTISIDKSCHEMRKLYAELKLPRFIWVCELFSRKSYEQDRAIGELILDATSSGLDAYASLIMIHYPGTIVIRLPNEPYDPIKWNICLHSCEPMEFWEPFPRLKFGHAY